jgi:radical SAM superfamily enzyme YgiQ (UPF0313 family)
MNVGFVFSLDEPIYTTKQNTMQLGISYISAVLKEAGHNTRLFVMDEKTSLHKIDSFIKQFKPKLLCFTAVSTQYPLMARVAARVKRKYPDVYLLAGGAHVSLNPEQAIKGSFDAICISEGEYPTLELVEKLDKGKEPTIIRNLWIKREGGKIEKNKTRPFMQNLDKLPFPDREMWQEWMAVPDSMHTILIGRGCPFNCSYCSNHALRKCAAGKYVRYRSIGSIVEEIRALLKRFPKARSIAFQMETIGIDDKWDMELFSALEELNSTLNRPITYGTNLRIIPNKDYKQFFEGMKRANFNRIDIGLESGSERIRKSVLRRLESNDDIIRVVKQAKNHGIEVGMFSLVGLPGESREDFQETIDMNRKCQPNSVIPSIFYPYPGTDIYRMSEEMGLLETRTDVRFERRQAVLDLPGFSRHQIQRAYDWFPYHVYKGKRPLLKILPQLLPPLLIRMKSIYIFDTLFYMFIKHFHKVPVMGFFVNRFMT